MSLPAVFRLLTLLLLPALVPAPASADTTLLNVSYGVTREFVTKLFGNVPVFDGGGIFDQIFARK